MPYDKMYKDKMSYPKKKKKNMSASRGKAYMNYMKKGKSGSSSSNGTSSYGPSVGTA